MAMFAEENITNNQFISYPVTVRSWLDYSYCELLKIKIHE
jgi:hypothetical protein